MNHKEDKRKIIVLPVIVFFLVFGLLTTLFLFVENRIYYQNREQHLYVAANQASIIEGCIDTVIARTYTLSAMVVENDGNTEFFDKVAKQIYDEVKTDTGVTLKNIAIAPAGKVEKVYPLDGNEGLINFDFMDKSKKGNEEAISAYHQGDLVLTNPFELSQGGVGMAGRLPVFIEKDNKREFWGLVTVTIDYERLMKDFQLDSLDNMGVNYNLWYENEDGKKVILESSEESVSDPVSYESKPKNLVWNLDVSPTRGWFDVKEIILGTIMILFVSFTLVYIILTREKIRNKNKEITNANEKLKELATKDSLTSCYSRHFVNTALITQPEGKWLDVSARYSLAIIDIDKFKNINDTYGHDVGDQAIVKVSSVLKETCDEKKGDCVIRHGGDEFVILYNNVSKAHFTHILENMRQLVHNIVIEEHPDIKLTVSVGGVSSDEEVDNYYDLLNKADEKLYISKESGRDRFTL